MDSVLSNSEKYVVFITEAYGNEIFIPFGNCPPSLDIFVHPLLLIGHFTIEEEGTKRSRKIGQ
jgi:hypothetical protein